MQFYKGTGLPIDAFKVEAEAGNQPVIAALAKFLMNSKHSVQIGIITIMLLAVGRVDFPYDKYGMVNQDLAAQAFEEFSRAYSKEASIFMQPLVLGKYSDQGYPTFSQLTKSIRRMASTIRITQEEYNANTRSFLLAANLLNPVVVPPQIDFNAVPKGFVVAHDLIYTMDGRTPHLDRFRVAPKAYKERPLLDDREYLAYRDYYEARDAMRDRSDYHYEKKPLHKVAATNDDRYRHADRYFNQDIDREIEELRRLKKARNRLLMTDRRILDPYAQVWPGSDVEGQLVRERLLRTTFLRRAQSRGRQTLS